MTATQARLLPVLPALVLLGAALGSSCVIRVSDEGISWFGSGSNKVTVDGVHLGSSHEEVLEIESWDARGLMIESSLGDLKIVPTDGPNQIVVTVYERTEGDGRAFYRDGRLMSESDSGEPTAIGEVTVLARDALPSLSLGTGLGDVELKGLTVHGTTDLSTGNGDIELESIRLEGQLTVSTGRGDVEVRDAICDDIRASTGLGDVKVRAVAAQEASFSSGFGDVKVARCDFEYLVADTGFGDVRCSETTYREGSLDTGLGKIRR